MKENILTLRSSRNKTFGARAYLPDTGIKAVMLIIPGMAEHSGRYAELAGFLTEEGFAVYAADHPGHGLTASCVENTGRMPGIRGWEIMLENTRSLYTNIRKQRPEVPIFIFGHSMGSILARHFTAVYPVYIHGLILSGTFDTPWLPLKAGHLIIKILTLVQGQKERNKWFNNLFYQNLNRHFKDQPTRFEWISSVREEVDSYVKDPYCGFNCTNAFYNNLFKGISATKKSQHNLKYRKTLPLLILGGQEDPVGNFGKDAMRIHRDFYKQRYQNLSIKIYRGRHELLHEYNKEEVMVYLLKWMKQNLPG
jgi:alpha-beta hydrolase superfamily lysophospholipase